MITYIKLINAKPGLKKISCIDLKIKEAIALSKLIKRLDEESVFYFEQREKICVKHGVLDKKKEAYFIPEENRNITNKKMQELNETEVDFGEKLKLTIPDCAVIDAASLLLCEDLIEFVF